MNPSRIRRTVGRSLFRPLEAEPAIDLLLNDAVSEGAVLRSAFPMITTHQQAGEIRRPG
jgi:hypothetical protein